MKHIVVVAFAAILGFTASTADAGPLTQGGVSLSIMPQVAFPLNDARDRMDDFGGGALLSTNYALKDNLALEVNLGGMMFSGIDGEKRGTPWTFQDWYVYSATVGAKYYPVKVAKQPPFIGAEVGYFRWDGNGSDSAGGGKNKIAFSPFIGAQADAGPIGIDVRLGYNIMPDFQFIRLNLGLRLLNF